MSATVRDGTHPKGNQPNRPNTADAGCCTDDAREERTMNDPRSDTTIPATLARMALVRRTRLSVNGAYHAPTDAA